jgi:diguanylate cyclase (GGDEF)-like protein/PAS domain S-box-containing protein
VRSQVADSLRHLMDRMRQQWTRSVTRPRTGLRSPASSERRSTRYVWLVCVVLIAIVTSQDGYTIWREHNVTIDQSETAATNLSAVLAEYTSRYIAVADLVLQGVQTDMRQTEGQTAASFEDRLTSPAVHDELVLKVKNIPGDNAVVLFGAEGQLLNTSRPGDVLKFNAADRDYFAHFRNHDDALLFIGLPAPSRNVSVPAQSRAVGSWTMFLARRLNAADGRFLGIIVAAIDIEYLQGFYQSILTNSSQTITLLRRDGVVIARYPDPKSSVGTSMPPGSPWYGALAANGGSYRSPGFFGAGPSIVAVRPLRDYPLAVDVVTTDSEALAVWWTGAIWQGVGSLITVTSFVALFWLIARQLHRLQRQSRLLREERDFSIALTSSLPGLFVQIDEGRRLVRWNENLAAMLGRSDEQLLGSDARAIVTEDDRDRVGGELREGFARGQAEIEFGVANKSGEVRAIRWSGRRITSDAHAFLLAVGTDVTNFRQAETRLRSSEARYRVLFESTRDAIMLLDPSTGKVTSANSSALKIFGAKDEEELLSRSAWERSPGQQPDGRESAEEAREMIDTAMRDGTHLFEWTYKRMEGTEFPVDVLLTRVVHGKDTLIYANIRDISDRKLAEAQIVRMARFDQLTGLANRHGFVEMLEQAIGRARRRGTCFAILYLDLDHFKDVNDTLGHPVGDALLKEVGDRLRANIREGDTVARFGGDEFAIILDDSVEPARVTAVTERLLGLIKEQGTPRVDVETGAAGVAEKIVKAMADPVTIQTNIIHSGATVGIAVYGSESPDAETMLSHADLALYQAKAERRGSYRFFSTGMDAEVRARIGMSLELREAIALNQFFLAYQPQVDIDTGRIVGLEALVRWHHPSSGILGPGKFIPAAERNGLIVPLGRWVMGEACRQTRRWLDAGVAPPLIAVNLSIIQFKRPLELEKDIAAALADSGLPRRLLELELTESVLMEASHDHRDVLHRLREGGTRLTIDDFGSGYSSLDYLRRYPVDRIKIAQTFIADIGVESSTDAIVRAALGLARELNIEVVVEGVETAAQLELLKAWGGRIVQGYYFARPLPVPEVTVLLRDGKITPARANPIPLVVSQTPILTHGPSV